jgi:predicted small metal-binding protein
MLGFKCQDIGFDCDYIVKGDNSTDILKKVMEHRKRDHTLKENYFTHSPLEKIRVRIHVVDEGIKRG